MKSQAKNVAASVRQKLLNFAIKTKEDFGLILTRYALERLLFRLSQSKHRDDFILKGAMLFRVWANDLHRPTRDLDLLGQGEPSPERCAAIFGEICEVDAPDDGITFHSDTITVDRIKEGQEYQGVRLTLISHIERARIPIQVDIGFGDAVVPQPAMLDYPTLLDQPAPRLRAYPMTAVLAEKLEAIFQLGMLNSRMKDFFDVWFLASTFPFEAAILSQAIQATFERRGSILDANQFSTLLLELDADATKHTQWKAFVNKSNIAGAPEFSAALLLIGSFMRKPISAAQSGIAPMLQWEPGSRWVAGGDLGARQE